VSEVKTLHIPFAKWLREAGVAFTYHRPDRATGATIGDPDFVLYRSGRVLMIEFKGPKTRISAGQLKRHAELAANGCPVHVIREIGIALGLVIAWKRQCGIPATPPPPASASGPYCAPHRKWGMAVYAATGEAIRRATVLDLAAYPSRGGGAEHGDGNGESKSGACSPTVRFSDSPAQSVEAPKAHE